MGLEDPGGRAFQVEGTASAKAPVWILVLLCALTFSIPLFGPEQSSRVLEEVVLLATCPAVPGAPQGRDPVMVNSIVTPDPTLTFQTHTHPDPHTHAQTHTPRHAHRDPHTMAIEKASVIVY